MSNTRIHDEWGAFSIIPNEFIDNAGDLSDQARWLFVLLRRYTNGQTGKAFPSYKLIQDRTGWTPKTIAKAVRELEEAGWMEREKTYNGPTNYILKRKSHFPQGSDALPVGKQGTSLREVGALPVGKSNKTDLKKIDKKIENTEPARAPRPLHVVESADIDSLGDAFDEAYPGMFNQWGKLKDMRELVKRLNANASHVREFPSWLKRAYPLKANNHFAFMDLFPEFVKQSPKKATKPVTTCGKCDAGYVVNDQGLAAKCPCQSPRQAKAV